jgi:iron complex transport system ATP-binding protein
MSPVLQATAVSLRIGAKTILDDIGLSCARGEAVALVGPNGAGKSTLLRVLSGELKPRSGTVRLRGRDLAAYAPRHLALHRAVLSQRLHVAFPFTVAEIVRMGAGEPASVRLAPLVDAALDEVGLTDLADRVVTTLSGGEQQRAHFARVLVQLAWGREHDGAGILLLDEPTAGLDLRHQLEMLHTLRRHAAAGVLVIAVLHDLNLAALFAQRIVVLDRGRVAQEGAPRDTITAAMLRGVFGVDATVSRPPPASDLPFVLPQAMTPRLDFCPRPR